MARTLTTPQRLATVTAAAVSLLAATGLPAAAATWTQAATVSAVNGVSDQQQVAVDGGGTATAVWSEELGPGLHAVKASQRKPGEGWSPAATLSDPARDAGEPQVVAAADGAVVVAWHAADGDGRRIVAARKPSGGTWSAAASISAVGGVSRPRLAGNPRGDAVLVWHQRNGLRASRLAAGAWGTPQPVSAGGLQHEVALDPAGAAYVVWKHADSAAIERVQVARGSSNGAWGTPKSLSRSDRNAERPTVGAGAQGDVQVAWVLQSSRKVVQGAHRLTDGTWSAVTSLSDLARNAVNPEVAVDARGAAVAVWQVSVTAADLSVAGARRTAAGGWSPPEQLAAAGASPQVGVDAQGAAYVAWLVNTAAGPNGVQAVVRPPTGLWSTPATVSAEGDVWSVGLAVNDGGRAVALWRQTDETGVASYSRVRSSTLE